jgi:hypothetical protein
MFCKYKNIFGEPGKGTHASRLFGLAVVDVVLTLIAAVIIALYFDAAIWKSIVGCFISGVVAHKLFCVDTALNKALFLTNN